MTHSFSILFPFRHLFQSADCGCNPIRLDHNLNQPILSWVSNFKSALLSFIVICHVWFAEAPPSYPITSSLHNKWPGPAHLSPVILFRSSIITISLNNHQCQDPGGFPLLWWHHKGSERQMKYNFHRTIVLLLFNAIIFVNFSIDCSCRKRYDLPQLCFIFPMVHLRPPVRFQISMCLSLSCRPPVCSIACTCLSVSPCHLCVSE